MLERGVIKDKLRATQVNSFCGMSLRRNITPTDIDGFIDYSGKAFIILEGKYMDAELPIGQRKALSNLANALDKANCPVMVIVYIHTEPIENDVVVKDCIVSQVYWNKKWHRLKNNRKVLDLIKSFEQFYEFIGL